MYQSGDDNKRRVKATKVLKRTASMKDAPARATVNRNAAAELDTESDRLDVPFLDIRKDLTPID